VRKYVALRMYHTRVFGPVSVRGASSLASIDVTSSPLLLLTQSTKQDGASGSRKQPWLPTRRHPDGLGLPLNPQVGENVEMVSEPPRHQVAQALGDVPTRVHLDDLGRPAQALLGQCQSSIPSHGSLVSQLLSPLSMCSSNSGWERRTERIREQNKASTNCPSAMGMFLKMER
jgi:hypothetical protein